MMALYVIEWLEGKRDKEALHKAIGLEHRSAITVMELSHEGLALIDGWGMRMPLMDRFYSIGSGGMSAMADMRRGVDPIDAVRNASCQDEATGIHPDYPPTVEYLVPKELTPRKRKR